MTLPSSGAISLAAIAAEFGKSAPYSFTDFYRGGAYVPDISANSAIPTSGAMNMLQFYGATAGPAIGGNFSSDDFKVSGTATSSVTFYNDGSVDQVGFGATVTAKWRDPLLAGTGSSYEIFITLVTGSNVGTGTVTAPTTGSWLPLSVNRLFSVGKGANGTVSRTWSFDIRRTSDNTVMGSGNVTCAATRDSSG